MKRYEGRLGVGLKPFLLHQDASILQNSPDFVDDDLDVDQQPAVTSQCGDVTFHPIVGEAGEGERAAGPHVEAWTVERLNDPAAKSPASVWSPQRSTHWLDNDWRHDWS